MYVTPSTHPYPSLPYTLGKGSAYRGGSLACWCLGRAHSTLWPLVITWVKAERNVRWGAMYLIIMWYERQYACFY